MQQPKPMPHLMHSRLPPIIPINRDRTAGHTPRKHITPIRSPITLGVLIRLAAILIRNRCRQRTISQQRRSSRSPSTRRTQITLKIDIQGAILAAAESALHASGGSVSGPIVADMVGRGVYVEGDVRGAVGGVEGYDLVVYDLAAAFGGVVF